MFEVIILYQITFNQFYLISKTKKFSQKQRLNQQIFFPKTPSNISNKIFKKPIGFSEAILKLNFFGTDRMLAPPTSIPKVIPFLKAIKCFTILNIKILKCQLKISTIKKNSKKKI
ncbi:hypothetical protein RFI_38242 [Reticulomyxa filosa]|uniref:Uncharacterized protein n=1 Tax=Reticulomyxa filosa TaxID=46433 RepID=X6LES1_RETFI|nr:hypothetical protein RFI_38242 [Reticulomyxa filosa]|eukprot:ETN99239.1 hypothetical protein RFI_38242 [Reticulomyxa filosa]